MAGKLNRLRDKPAGTEKITINLGFASGGEIPTDEIRRAGAALKGIPELAQKEDAFFNKTATLVFSIFTAHRVGYIVRYARSAPDCPDTCPNVTRLLGACR